MRIALSFLALHLGACLSLLGGETAFGVTNIWAMELRTAPQAWTKLTSSREFTQADVTIDGKIYDKVAVRLKRGGTSGGAHEGRPPLHLEFKGQSVAGVTLLSLNNNYFDRSYLRDVLSYKLCNDFGLAAPKTAFVKVYVSTNQSTPAHYLGLYTATEIVDGGFLRERFGSSSGLLMKPQLQGAAQGVSWPKQIESVDTRTGPSPEQQEQMQALLKLINQNSNAAFQEEISSRMDLDNYLRFVVVNVALANLDSYLGMGKNFYLYLNPKTGKLTWIPWDFDLSFGGFFLCGTPEERIHLSIDSPTQDRLLKRLLAIPEVNERYRLLLREFVEKHLQVPALEQQIDELSARIEPSVNEETEIGRRRSFKGSLDERNGGGFARRGGWGIDIGLKQFIEGRVASIEAQLAGQEKGAHPVFK